MKTSVLVALILSFFFSGTVGDQLCMEEDGECINWPTNVCTAGWEEELCSGGRNRRCCLSCDAQCEVEEVSFQQNDTECTNARGNCRVMSNFCNGRYEANKCGGPSNRQCCDPKSSPPGNCPLLTYAPTDNTKGLNDYPVRIHPEFLPAMEQIDQAARECNVTVFITHSFRKRQQRPNESSRNVTMRSNHLAGHAIDFAFLQTSTGPCNGRCLLDRNNVDGNCFIRRIKEFGLQWGGDFTPSDPVHIDDGFADNAAAWKERVQLLQTNC